jgi:2-keto-4-pentenoate hydratase/2-oxohepta-3-ene-1,7-dioic acid hydratase in catechol pathway
MRTKNDLVDDGNGGMHLVTIRDDSGERAALLRPEDDRVVEIGAHGLPGTMSDIVALGDAAKDRLALACAEGRTRPLGDVELLAPVPAPRRDVICVGRNYHEHVGELHRSGYDTSAATADVPDVPVVFSKMPSSVVGPGVAIATGNDPSGSTDYEGELAVVIGKGGREIPRASAFEHVFGYTIVNDVTARRIQQGHRQWFLGKNIDGFCPMGPALVTADEIPDVTDLTLVTRVNGEVRQNARVRDLIFDIPALIETISALITLQPGDIIATGTPSGVGLGFEPPRFLQPGDRVEIEIQPIGKLVSPVV